MDLQWLKDEIAKEPPTTLCYSVVVEVVEITGNIVRYPIYDAKFDQATLQFVIKPALFEP